MTLTKLPKTSTIQSGVTQALSFCGGTHVAKTGDIKDFVITEEIGIAKGIRRIVAVTGQEAQDIGRLAQSLQSKLDVLEQSEGKIKDNGLKLFSVELGQADISILKKNDLKKRLEVIRKVHDKQSKEREIELNKEAVDRFHAYFKEEPNADAYIAILDVEGNTKVLQSLVSQAKRLAKGLYIFSIEPENQKVMHANYVPPPLKVRGADARTWASKVTDILQGKSGGKEDSAQGVGLDCTKLEEALDTAKQYLSSLKT